ncbi:MAG TPA: ankyrin repeat domain-containing protein [Terracidiphilus sp.]|nr:ankyrin repeat domain-containing protein [Terracidiphilus sp.]
MQAHIRRFVLIHCTTALLLACSAGRFAVADPVHDAARKGNMTKLKELVAANPAVVSSVDKMGKTPLFFAAESNQLEAATFLIEHGTDVNAKDKNGGFTALDLALSSYHYIEMVRLLVEHGANVNTASSQGITPLDEAAMRGQKDAIEVLIAKGADVNARDEKGNSPLLWALLMGRTDAAVALVEAGADVNARNAMGMSPLTIAKRRDNRKLEELLVSKGARE